jgi:hypothetical protein
MITQGERRAIAVVTLLSVAMLIWAFAAAIPGWFGSVPLRDSTEFVIEKSQAAVGTPSADMHVLSVIADGRLLRSGEMRPEGDWAADWIWGGHTRGEGPASVRVPPSKRLAVQFGTHPNGPIAKLSAGEQQSEVDLAGPWARIWVDFPRPEAPYWILPAFAFALLILVMIVRPWSGRRRLASWLWIHMLIQHGLYWSTQPVAASGDTAGYFAALDAFLQGQPSYYPPGYPLLFWMCSWFTGDIGTLVTAIQHVWFLLCFHWLFKALGAAFSPAAAYATCLLGSSTFAALAVPQMAISEAIATIGIGGSLWFGWRASATGSKWPALAGGLLLGWAVLARAVPIAAALPGLLVLHFLPWRQRQLRTFALTMAATAAVPLASMLWTGAKSGDFRLSDSAPAHLYNHFVYCQRLLDENGPKTRELQSLIGEKDPRDLAHWDVSALLFRRGFTSAQCQELYAHVNREAAATATWWEHLTFVCYLTWRQILADPFLSAPDRPWMDHRVPAIEVAPVLHIDATTMKYKEAIQDVHTATWPAIAWLFVIGCVITPFLSSRRLLLPVALAPLGYLFATACVEYFLERYSVAVYPFMFCIAAVPILVAIDRANSWLARRGAVAAPPPPVGATLPIA